MCVCVCDRECVCVYRCACGEQTPDLVLAGELLVGDMRWEVCVEDRTERQTVVPATAEVSDVNVLEKEARRERVSE